MIENNKLYFPLTSEHEISRVQERLNNLFFDTCEKISITLGFQGGSVPSDVYYSEKYNIWFCPSIAQSESGEERYWNAFGINKPTKNESIVCEINIPIEGINRRIAGIFATDSEDGYALLHSGKIGGGRPGINKALFTNNYRGNFINVMYEGEKKSLEYALVANLSDANAIQQIANFVNEVHRIKCINIGNEDDFTVERQGAPPIFNEEFFGTKYIESQAYSSTNNHGIIVNALANILFDWGYDVGNNRNIDLFTVFEGKIDAIFEVKPNYENANLYSAIGQTIIYSIDNDEAAKFIVIPAGINEKIRKQLEDYGINILDFEWIGDEPVFLNLDDYFEKG